MFRWACACLLGHATWKYTYISFAMYTHTRFYKHAVWLLQSKIDPNSVGVLGLNPKGVCPKWHTCSTYPDNFLSVQSHDQSVRQKPVFRWPWLCALGSNALKQSTEESCDEYSRDKIINRVRVKVNPKPRTELCAQWWVYSHTQLNPISCI